MEGGGGQEGSYAVTLYGQEGESMSTQIRANHIAYNEKYRQQMEQDNLGRIALMHDGEIVEVYNDMGDAYLIGCEKFGLGNFLMKRIGQRPAQLGIHSITV